MTSFKTLALLVLAATTIVPKLSAETHCPGNVASLPFRLVNRHQMIVPVSINHAGPFSFLLDTGTQMTMVEPALAAALHLETTGKAEVASVGLQASASFARALDSARFRVLSSMNLVCPSRSNTPIYNPSGDIPIRIVDGFSRLNAVAENEGVRDPIVEVFNSVERSNSAKFGEVR